MSLINNSFKTFLISLLSLTLLFSISCSNEGTTGGGTGGGTETTETIEAKDFPTELLGTYEHYYVSGDDGKITVSTTTTTEGGIQKTYIYMQYFLKRMIIHLLNRGIMFILKNGRRQPKSEKLLNLKANVLIILTENM